MRPAGWKAKEGWLTKQGHLRPNWLSRYFLLEETSLTYFKTVGDRVAQGTIQLRDAHVVPDPAPIKGRPWVLRIEPAAHSTSTPKKRSPAYLLQARNEADFISWKDAISWNVTLLQAHNLRDITGVADCIERVGAELEKAAVEEPSPGPNSGTLSPHAALAPCPPQGIESVPEEKAATSAAALPPGASGASSTFARIRIFTGTWNMAEIQPPSNLGSAWIDRSCDVVAIGLQECMHLNQALSAVRSHLGPGFLEISHSIGSTTKTLGFHGHIVLGVWVREWLVSSKVCRLSQGVRGSVLLGRNLLLTRAPNKGAVAIALPVRLPSSSGALKIPSALVFISCHLTSDSSGDSRLDARNRNAYEIINQLGLDLSEEAIARAASEMQAAGSLDGAAVADASKAANVLSPLPTSEVILECPVPIKDAGASFDVAALPLGPSHAPRDTAVTEMDADGAPERNQTLQSATERSLQISAPTQCHVSTEKTGRRWPRASVATRVGELFTIDSDSSSSIDEDVDNDAISPVRGLLMVDDDDHVLVKALSSDNLTGPQIASSQAFTLSESTYALPSPVSPMASPSAGRIRRSLSHPLSASTLKLVRDLHCDPERTLSRDSVSRSSGDPASKTDRVFTDSTPSVVVQGPSTPASAGSTSDAKAHPVSELRLPLSVDTPGQVVNVAPRSKSRPVLRRASDASALFPSHGGRGGGPLLSSPDGTTRNQQFWGGSSRSLVTSRELNAAQATISNPVGGSRVPLFIPAQTVISGPVGGSRAPLFSKSALFDTGTDKLHQDSTAAEDAAAAAGSSDAPLRVSASRSYVILFGDLNYRIRMSPDAALQAICRAGTALQHPVPDSAREQSPWAELLQHEELRQQLAIGSAFRGFGEPPLCFAPSYRRKKSSVPLLMPSRGDLTSIAKISQAYSTVVGPADDPMTPSAASTDTGLTDVRSLRTPSYTDRVLVRLPVLAGVQVLRERFEEEFQQRRSTYGGSFVSTGVFANVSETSSVPDVGAGAIASSYDETGLRRGSGASTGWGDGDDEATAADVSYSEHAKRGTSDDRFIPFPVLTCVDYSDCEQLVGSDHSAIRAVFELPLLQHKGAELSACASGPGDESVPASTLPFPFELSSPLVMLAAAAQSRRNAALASALGFAHEAASARDDSSAPDAYSDVGIARTQGHGGIDPQAGGIANSAKVADLSPYRMNDNNLARFSEAAIESALEDMPQFVDGSLCSGISNTPSTYVSCDQLEKGCSGAFPSQLLGRGALPLLVPPPFWLATPPVSDAVPYENQSCETLAHIAASRLHHQTLPPWVRTAPLFVVPCGPRSLASTACAGASPSPRLRSSPAAVDLLQLRELDEYASSSLHNASLSLCRTGSDVTGPGVLHSGSLSPTDEQEGVGPMAASVADMGAEAARELVYLATPSADVQSLHCPAEPQTPDVALSPETASTLAHQPVPEPDLCHAALQARILGATEQPVPAVSIGQLHGDSHVHGSRVSQLAALFEAKTTGPHNGPTANNRRMSLQ